MVNPAWTISKTTPYHCPMCGGELFIDKSAPRSGTPCPLCREPLSFLLRPSDDGVILTLLAGSWRAAGNGWGTTVLSGLPTASSLVVDLSRLRALPGATLDALKAIHQKFNSTGGQMRLCGVHPQVAESLEKAGLGTFVEPLVNQAVLWGARGLQAPPTDVVAPLAPLPLVFPPTGDETIALV